MWKFKAIIFKSIEASIPSRRAKEVYVTEVVYNIHFFFFLQGARGMVQIERTMVSILRASFDYNEWRRNVIF